LHIFIISKHNVHEGKTNNLKKMMVCITKWNGES